MYFILSFLLQNSTIGVKVESLSFNENNVGSRPSKQMAGKYTCSLQATNCSQFLFGYSESKLKQSPTFRDYWSEFSGAVEGSLMGLFVVWAPIALGGCIALEIAGGEGDDAAIGFLFGGLGAGMVVGMPIGAAFGVNNTGKQIKQEGSFWKAMGGGFLGVLGIFGGPLVLITIPIGAVIGYNL